MEFKKVVFPIHINAYRLRYLAGIYKYIQVTDYSSGWVSSTPVWVKRNNVGHYLLMNPHTRWDSLCGHKNPFDSYHHWNVNSTEQKPCL